MLEYVLYILWYFNFCFQLSPLKDEPYSVSANKTTYTVEQLDAYTTYKFAVYAKNSRGSSVKSAVVKATTPQTCKSYKVILS